ncbi:hypothetical protein LEMLEM_LOCUS794, partial [Lemmus lemmus]
MPANRWMASENGVQMRNGIFPSCKGKKMGPKDNTLIWLIRRQNAEDTAMGLVWITSARTISTWTTNMVSLDKTLSPCQ